MRRAVIDALEGRSILFGGEASSKSPPDAYGRLSTNDLDIALSEFDERIRTTVKSVLSRVGASSACREWEYVGDVWITCALNCMSPINGPSTTTRFS
jgi:hypothetical protein